MAVLVLEAGVQIPAPPVPGWVTLASDLTSLGLGVSSVKWAQSRLPHLTAGGDAASTGPGACVSAAGLDVTTLCALLDVAGSWEKVRGAEASGFCPLPPSPLSARRHTDSRHPPWI